MQRAFVVARGDLRFRALGLLDRQLECGSHERIQLRVQGFDPVDIVLDLFDG